ncbi:sensor domain-containing diguanylate cyclase [Vulcaniibacterium gelatinicum]|uniref:sensor domain-containing diguanylate cyclase n=1 Tax=Vulcaniibacterium gelatinicum TaxID=2598725 RepID=UPI0015F2D5EA|nr:sensor domain-containing diguanylate cyclase [Vulcaniibacterium gelatinicum]
MADRPTTAMNHQQRLQRLVCAIQELSLARDLDAVAAIVRRAAHELTGADGATFVLREGDQCFYKDEEAIAPLWKGQRFPMERCISGWAMQHRQAVVIEDIYSDERIPADAYRPTFVASLVMVPIRTLDPIGAIGNYWATPHRAGADEVAVLQALADSTSVALENVRMYAELEQRVAARTEQLAEVNRQLQQEMVVCQNVQEEERRLSVTDELTGLCNRRGFMTVAERELEIARRHGRTGALVFLDLDGLKLCNDTYGHAAGDAQLTAAAEVLRAAFRRTDVIARLGGDEFIVMVTEARDGLQAVLSRLAATVARANLRRDGGPPLAFSVGAVALSGDDDLEQLMAQADRAMYADKLRRRSAAHPMIVRATSH